MSSRRKASPESETLLKWEACLKELTYLRFSHLIESTIEIQRRHSSAAELPCLEQIAVGVLWSLIDQTLSLPDDFELTAKRAIESQVKKFKRSVVNEYSAAEHLKTLNDGVQWPSDELERQELKKIFDEAFRCLSYAEARTLVLLYGLGDRQSMRVSEVAALENVSPKTVRNRERRAFHLLRKDERIRSLVS